MPERLPQRILGRFRAPRAIFNMLMVVLLVTAVAGAYLLLRPEDGSAAPATTEVTRGTVVSLVSATGNVVAARDVGVDFTSGGELITVSVKVGDQVEQGDVLATVDTADATEQRDSAQASYDQAEANLRQVTQGATEADLAANNASVRQAVASVSSAERAWADSRRVARTNRAVYDQQVRGARRSLENAEDSLAKAQTLLATAREALEAAHQRENDGCAASTDGSTGPGTSACTSAQAATDSADQSVTTAQSTLTSAGTTLENARDTLRTAEQSRSVGNAQQAQSIGSAQSSLNSAQASYDYTLASAGQQTQPATDAEIDSARAQLASAAVSVRSAQRSLNETTLRAPASGIVASISATVGEYVGGSGTAGASDTSATSSSGAGSSTSSIEASGFVVLTGVDGLQVEAEFSEADVSLLNLGRGVSVSFEALDNAGVTSATNAVITSIAPASVVIDNVVTYRVNATLDAPPKRLKVGQTASLEVVLAEAQDALQVPSSAITTTGETSTVVVLVTGQEEQREVKIGVVGDSTSEIISGLEEGDRVVTSRGGGGVGGFPGVDLPTLPGGGLG